MDSRSESILAEFKDKAALVVEAGSDMEQALHKDPKEFLFGLAKGVFDEGCTEYPPDDHDCTGCIIRELWACVPTWLQKTMKVAWLEINHMMLASDQDMSVN